MSLTTTIRSCFFLSLLFLGSKESQRSFEEILERQEKSAFLVISDLCCHVIKNVQYFRIASTPDSCQKGVLRTLEPFPAGLAGRINV